MGGDRQGQSRIGRLTTRPAPITMHLARTKVHLTHRPTRPHWPRVMGEHATFRVDAAGMPHSRMPEGYRDIILVDLAP